MQRVDITHDFTKPVPQVYAWLSEHENLGPLFGASVERVRDGPFAPHGTGTRLHYVIEFGAVVPGLDRVVKRSLERSIPRALPRVDVHA